MGMGTFQGVGPIQFGSIDGASPISHVTADSAKRIAEPGDRVTYLGEEYVYIYNAGASDASIGRGMVMSSLSGYSLTVSSTAAGYDVPFCLVKHASILAGNYGWGLVRGVGPVALGSTAATGVWLALGDDGIFNTYLGSSNTDVVQGTPVAKVVSSGTGISTTGLARAFIRCYG